MKTTIDILFRLFAEYTGEAVPETMPSPFSKEAPLKLNYFNVSDLVAIIEVKGDGTAIAGSVPSRSYIKRAAAFMIVRKDSIPRGERFSFNRIDPLLHIGAVEYGQDKPSEMQVSYGRVSLIPGSTSNLMWINPCQRIVQQAYYHASEFQREVDAAKAVTSK